MVRPRPPAPAVMSTRKPGLRMNGEALALVMITALFLCSAGGANVSGQALSVCGDLWDI